MDGGEDFRKARVDKHQPLAAKQETKLIGERFGETGLEASDDGHSAVRFGIGSQVCDDFVLAIHARRDLKDFRESVCRAVIEVPAGHASPVIAQQDPSERTLHFFSGAFNEGAERPAVVAGP